MGLKQDLQINEAAESIRRVLKLHPDVRYALALAAREGQNFSITAAADGSPEELAALVWGIERIVQNRGVEFASNYQHALIEIAEGWSSRALG